MGRQASKRQTKPEEWRRVAGHTAYEVSNLGRVRYNHRATVRILKQFWRNSSLCVSLTVAGKVHRKAVCGIVAAAFLPPAPEAGVIPIHRNGMTSCNEADNLFWGTREDLGRAASRERRRGVEKVDPVTGEIVDTYTSIKLAGAKNNYSSSTIQYHVSGKAKGLANGYIYRLA